MAVAVTNPDSSRSVRIVVGILFIFFLFFFFFFLYFIFFFLSVVVVGLERQAGRKNSRKREREGCGDVR